MSLTPRFLSSVSNLQPELGALGLSNPQAQQLLLAGRVQPQRQVNRLACNLLVLPHLHRQAIQVNDRIHAVQGPGLPGNDVINDRIGHSGNQ